MKKGKKIVLSGSMRFRDVIRNTMQQLTLLGFEPMFPNVNYSEANSDKAETLTEKSRLAWDHYQAIDQSDAIYFIVPNGYMGTSCKLELGYALAKKKPIYFSELTHDIGLDCYVKEIIPLSQLEKFAQLYTR